MYVLFKKDDFKKKLYNRDSRYIKSRDVTKITATGRDYDSNATHKKITFFFFQVIKIDKQLISVSSNL